MSATATMAEPQRRKEQHKTVSHEEWLVARNALLEAEKELMRRSDEGMASRLGGNPVADNAAVTGTNVATYTRERPGMSAFALEDETVYHTYSAYARGLDVLWGAYQWLDRAPKGRNETDFWWRRHDEYEKKRRAA